MSKKKSDIDMTNKLRECIICGNEFIGREDTCKYCLREQYEEDSAEIQD